MASRKGSKPDVLPRLRSRTQEILSWWCQGKGKLAETSKESIRKIETEVLRHVCRSIGEEIKFPIPKVGSSVASSSLDPTILEAHIKFRFAAEPWLDVNVKKNEKKFAKELDSIYSTFPAITDRATILLAMAAWFSILCEVDDLTENMEPMDAKRALQDARSMTWKDSGTSLGTGIDWSKPNSSHEMIQHIVREFRIYTHHLLPAATYNVFMEDINKVFTWMITETNFRESPPPSVDAYMKIRGETVGISPFFALVESSLNKSMSYLRPLPSASVTDLKSMLNEIIGLQNDLIGLDKDIDAGWSVNVVTVLGGLRLRYPGSPEDRIRILKDCAREAEKMYADAIRNAIECCEVIYRNSKVESERELCKVMMEFIGRCLKWAIASQRYKTK
ncbi:isoprenoid synthase domain-containing protein [Cadophora sp. MPI-SDFR-AT-0126]|nr:isoprenoid synthase domain-containing protein [Leotiomycetes sp. MPI-SDFR-AT-0126]